MNADVLKGKWHQLKGEVKSQWGELTDDDLDRVGGDSEKLIGRCAAFVLLFKRSAGNSLHSILYIVKLFASARRQGDVRRFRA